MQGLHQDQQAEELGPHRDEQEPLGADDRAGGGVRAAESKGNRLETY